MIYDFLNYIVGAVIGLVVTGFTWLIKNVLTNKEQIALLQSEIQSRDARRVEDREIMQEIKADLKEVKRDIIELYRHNPE